MNKKERVQAALLSKNLDRPPISLWMNYPEVDQEPLSLAKAHIAFQEKFDLDFIKLTPFDLYSVQDCGCQIQFFCQQDQNPTIYKYAINNISDWQKLEYLPPQIGALGKQLLLTKYVNQLIGDNVPFVQTVYSPLTTAYKLAGEKLFDHLRHNPTIVHKALEVITATTIDFIKANIQAGAAGIFFATACAKHNLLSNTEYNEFARYYDFEVLRGARGGWFNTLHIHGHDILFDELLDYPVHALNWHDSHEYPPLRRARAMTDLCIIGGLDEAGPIVNGSPSEVIDEVSRFLTETNLTGVMVGPGCVTTTSNIPENNITATRLVVERYGDKDLCKYLSIDSSCL